MAEPRHLRADRIHNALAAKMREAKGSHPTATLSSIDCHPEDRELLSALQYLKRGCPMNEPVWRTLSQAAVNGDLFVVARHSGDSVERLAKLRRGREGIHAQP
jgi:hypothetical protein